MYHIRIEFDKFKKEFTSEKEPEFDGGILTFTDKYGVLNVFNKDKIISYHVEKR